jgi:acetyltransferase
MNEQIDKVFRPRSVAIAGVSSRMDNPGTLALRSIRNMGFEGPVYPVNPKYDEVFDLPCYPSIRELPVVPDQVILAVPPSAVPALAAECVETGVSVCVINTAGFSETGRAEGIELEQQLIAAIEGSGMRLVGPNCMGVYSSTGRLALFDGQAPGNGSVSLISQSGSFCSFLYLLGTERAIQFSKMVSSGNELDLTCADYLEYLADDAETDIIVAYLEEVRDARRFLEAALSLKGKKPFVVWKSGLTGSGKKAAASHTGAMVGSEDIWRAVERQAGIVPSYDLPDTIDVLSAFYHLRRPLGRRVCVVSPPGGIAVSCADAVEKNGLSLPGLHPETTDRLAAILPREGTGLGNPVDMGFGAVVPGNLKQVIEAVAPDENIDTIMVVAGAPAARKGDPGLVKMHTAEIKEAAPRGGKPLVVIGIPSGIAFPHMAELSWAGIPCYLSPDAACKALSRVSSFNGL